MFQTHPMFMDQYTETRNAIDPITERNWALGHDAPGSYGRHAELASIKETIGVPKAHAMVRQLIAGLEAVVRRARSVLPVAQGANDQPTLDVLGERHSIRDKSVWMLRLLFKKRPHAMHHSSSCCPT